MKNKTYLFLLLPLLTSCSDIFEKNMEKETVQLLVPANGEVSYQLTNTFIWEEVDKVEYYNIEIVSPSFDSLSSIILDSNVTSVYFVYTLSPGEYQWRVRAENSSSVSPYTTYSLTIGNDTLEDLSSKNVLILSPSNGLVTNQLSFSFSWYTTPYADDYRLEIATPDFNGTPLISPVITSETSYSYSFSEEGNYQWRVRAQNQLSNSLYTTYSLTIDTTSPHVPTLVTPAANVTLTDSVVTLYWDRGITSGSALYDSVYIYDDTLVYLPVKAVKTQNTSGTHTLNTSEDYFWRVRSFDAAGNKSNYSATRKFSVQ